MEWPSGHVRHKVATDGPRRHARSFSSVHGMGILYVLAVPATWSSTEGGSGAPERRGTRSAGAGALLPVASGVVRETGQSA